MCARPGRPSLPQTYLTEVRSEGGVSGKHVAVNPSGQFIVCGNRRSPVDMEIEAPVPVKPTLFGPSGGSAFSAGKKPICTK